MEQFRPSRIATDDMLTPSMIGQISLDSVLCASPNQVSSRVGEEAAILDLERSIYYSLDPVGARIFELFQRPIRLADVLAVVVAEYSVEYETARADLLALVEDLLSKDLLVIRDPDAA
jgi:hypothetical protein